MADALPDNNTQVAQVQAARNLKLAGLILLCVSAVLPSIGFVFPSLPTLFADHVPEFLIFLIAWLIGMLGAGIYGKNEWSVGWVILAAIPVLGPLTVLVAIAVDSLLAKCAVGNIARRIAGFAVAMAGIGVLASVVIPNYLNYPMTARQGEAKANLGNIWQAEKKFYDTHKRYGTFEEIGFKPTGSSRYTYRIDQTGRPGTIIRSYQDASGAFDNSVVPSGFSATGFTATATGNIDSDPTIDQWHVNDMKQSLNKADIDDVRN